MRLCLIRICVYFLFRTASSGDAPNWPYSYGIRVIWARLRVRSTDAFQVPSAVACFVQVSVSRWVHTHPLRQRDDKSHSTWEAPSAWVVMLACHSLAHYSYLCCIHKCTWVLVIVYIIVQYIYYFVYIYYECWVRLCYFTSNEAIKISIFIPVSMCFNLPSYLISYCLTAQDYAGSHSTLASAHRLPLCRQVTK